MNPFSREASESMGQAMVDGFKKGLQSSAEAHKLIESNVSLRVLLEMQELRHFADMAIRGMAASPHGYVLAVDFDGTLCLDCYPNIGPACIKTIAAAVHAQRLGIKLILWTCREGKALKEALAWCRAEGLEFDAVNENTAERKALYQNDCRKVGYDELWDDKATGVPYEGETAGPFSLDNLMGGT
ncbi:hypothetical protein LJC74_01115 [Eubacteriales bacterium OttesenSCG-928-A19]|nr:hypothetical protein [Eubacteriales bacterium OttesenSCG-928-A19]